MVVFERLKKARECGKLGEHSPRLICSLFVNTGRVGWLQERRVNAEEEDDIQIIEPQEGQPFLNYLGSVMESTVKVVHNELVSSLSSNQCSIVGAERAVF